MERIIAYFRNQHAAHKSAEWFITRGLPRERVDVQMGGVDQPYSDALDAKPVDQSEDCSLVVHFADTLLTYRACSFLKDAGAYLIDITEHAQTA